MFKKLLHRKSASRWLGSETQLELENHFTVLSKLGKGSYAVVYKVRRHEDGQQYALKVADIKTLGPLEQADVVNEIRLLASLHHPNLTTFHEAFSDHGKLCIVQELVGGGDIDTLLMRRRASGIHFTEAQVWATFLQIALGLQYLHHNHVLHRDLKPHNLLVTEGGLIKLADLGISQVLDRVFTHTMIGTPHYMAPEMWRRQPYSYSADIWALGCILHELCTLKPLFLAGSDQEVRDKVLSGVVPPLPSRYSLDLQRTVAQLLQQHPASRPTMDDFLMSPAAQQHLALLPAELQQRCISPGLSWEQDLARMMQPIKVPQRTDEWEVINELMPTPRYASGSGVSSALRRKKKSFSTGDLQALAAATADNGDDGAAAGSLGGGGGAPPLTAAAAATAMRKSQSHGSLLSAAVEAEIERSSSSLMRRNSLSVGELLMDTHGSGGSSGGGSGVGGGGRGGGPQLGALHRRRSAHYAAALDAVAEETGGHAGARAAGTAGAAGTRGAAGAAGAAGGSQPDDRSVRGVRSKSLSVEDALEVMASGQEGPFLLLGAKPQQGGQLAPQAGAPAAAPASVSGAPPPPRLAVAEVPALPPPGKPLLAPAVTAQVQLGAAGLPADADAAGIKAQQDLQQQPQQPQQIGQQQELPPEQMEGKKKQKQKKVHFWQQLKGGSHKH